MTTPTRRAFLGLFGCGVIGLATDWSGALKGLRDLPARTAAPTLTGRGWASSLFIPAAEGSFLRPDGTDAANAGVNTAVIVWEPARGIVCPWQPWSIYWSWR